MVIFFVCKYFCNCGFILVIARNRCCGCISLLSVKSASSMAYVRRLRYAVMPYDGSVSEEILKFFSKSVISISIPDLLISCWTSKFSVRRVL